MSIPTSVTRPRPIIDERAYSRLLALAERARAQVPDLADRLIEEIERADLRASSEMPGDVVTLGSEVTYRQGERAQTVQIVAPKDTNIHRNLISIHTPVSAALHTFTLHHKISCYIPDKPVPLLE